jgi:acyl-CoA reductase-like NAD-dependent aldehyde dehydrogenase
MASVEQRTPADHDGEVAAPTIGVENPATGELIATNPVLGASELGQMAARGREAQLQWAAIGFDGRARIMRRAQKWMLDNVARVTDTVRGLRQGEPTGIGTVDVGAVVFAPQLEIIDEHVRDAVAKGARVLAGGHSHSERGRYFDPTVLVDVDHSMKCMQEETFGPTPPIMKIANAEEGVRLANDSDYGLQASVWTADIDRGEALARRIHAGVVCVNNAHLSAALRPGG